MFAVLLLLSIRSESICFHFVVGLVVCCDVRHWLKAYTCERPIFNLEIRFQTLTVIAWLNYDAWFITSLAMKRKVSVVKWMLIEFSINGHGLFLSHLLPRYSIVVTSVHMCVCVYNEREVNWYLRYDDAICDLYVILLSTYMWKERFLIDSHVLNAIFFFFLSFLPFFC